MSVSMPAVVVLILCKTVIAGPPDQNSSYTGYENRQWATENSMMVCRREVVQLEDAAASMGADPLPFNEQRCMRSALMLGPNWDQDHKSSAYRVWRTACPTRVINTITKETIGWVLPDCGHRDVVKCEKDSII